MGRLAAERLEDHSIGFRQIRERPEPHFCAFGIKLSYKIGKVQRLAVGIECCKGEARSDEGCSEVNARSGSLS